MIVNIFLAYAENVRSDYQTRPLTGLIFAVSFRRRKRGTGWKKRTPICRHLTHFDSLKTRMNTGLLLRLKAIS